MKKLKNKITSYRNNVNNLKNNHRNKRIAHINSIEFPDLLEFLDFENIIKPLLKEANELADFIWGEEISVKFKLGSQEGILDFRHQITNLSIDFNKIKEIR